MDIVWRIGKKIDGLRQELGMSQEDLANLLGVTRPTVSRYLKGEQPIDSAKLLKLAHHFNCPVQYFFEDESDSLSFMFRADHPSERVDDVLLKKVNQRMMEVAEIFEEAEGIQEFTIPDAHRITIRGVKQLDDVLKNKIRLIAEEQNRLLQLDANPDIYRVLEDYGIIVYAMKLPEGIFALSGYSNKFGAFIVINNSPGITEERNRFSCAHELGHLVMHRDEYSQSIQVLKYHSSRTDLRERMADHFANYLLIPRDRLYQAFEEIVGFSRRIEPEDVILLKKRFGVSALALAYALKLEDLISQNAYGFLKKYFESNYGTSEPEPLQPIEKNQKLRYHLRNLAKKGEIGTKKVAELLELPMSEARSLMKEWTKLKPDRGDNPGDNRERDAGSLEEFLW